MRHPAPRRPITPGWPASRAAGDERPAGRRRWRSQNPSSLVNRPLPSVMRSLSYERALVIVARVVLQDVANIRRVRDEVATSRADPEYTTSPKRRAALRNHRRRVAPERRQHAEDWKPVRTRWKLIVRSVGRLSFHERDYIAIAERRPSLPQPSCMRDASRSVDSLRVT